jgi:hypothetical protein
MYLTPTGSFGQRRPQDPLDKEFKPQRSALRHCPLAPLRETCTFEIASNYST